MKTLTLAAVMALAAPALRATQVKPPADKVAPVEALYISTCQPCHGPDGKPPVKEMGFVDRVWKTKTVAESAKTIREGVPGTAMLPFKGRLTEKDILALAKYVRSLDKKPVKK